MIPRATGHLRAKNIIIISTLASKHMWKSIQNKWQTNIKWKIIILGKNNVGKISEPRVMKIILRFEITKCIKRKIDKLKFFKIENLLFHEWSHVEKKNSKLQSWKIYGKVHSW